MDLRIAIIGGLLGITSVCMAAEKKHPAPTPADPSAAQEFTVKMYRELAGKEQGNLFFSPFSVSSALGILHGGAKGDTALEIAGALGYADDKLREELGALTQKFNAPGKPYQLSVANALWADKTFALRKEYSEAMEKSYGAGSENVDFVHQAEAARGTINQWVEQRTKDRIKDLLPAGSLDNTTRLVITNAIYFKGDWNLKFDKSATKDEPFHLADGKDVTAPLMQRHFREARFGEADGAQLLELPYKGKELSMVLILPPKGEAMAKFESGLTAEKLGGLLGHLGRRDVDVFLPRFKFTTGIYELTPMLKSMGIAKVFEAGKADLTGLSDSPESSQLCVSGVYHKAFILVDEEGSEAAAATGVVVATRAALRPEEPKVFRADRPFVFLIRDQASGTILFMGRLNDPR